MSAMAEDIAEYLESLGLGAKGTDIFRGMLRDQPDDAVVIVEGGGLGADRSHDFRRDRNKGVAITVRAAPNNYVDGSDRADKIYDAMLFLANTAFNGGDRYKGTVPLGDVSDIGRDEKDRWKWSMSFVVKKS